MADLKGMAVVLLNLISGVALLLAAAWFTFTVLETQDINEHFRKSAIIVVPKKDRAIVIPPDESIVEVKPAQ